MRLPFVLLVVASALVSAADANDTYSTVVLAGAATEAGDGFYIRIDPDRATEKTPKGSPYAAVTFDAYVPRVVGKTDLGSVYLEVVGRDGRTWPKWRSSLRILKTDLPTTMYLRIGDLLLIVRCTSSTTRDHLVVLLRIMWFGSNIICRRSDEV